MDPATETRTPVSTTGRPADTDRLATALRTLSIRCHDSEAGYRRAAEDTNDEHFKFEFEQLADERRGMAEELDRCLEELGHAPTGASSPMGTAHRLYLDLKSLISGGDKRAVFREVARGESAFEQAYDEALRIPMSDSMRRRLQIQHRNVSRARDYYAALARHGAGIASETGSLAHRASTQVREHPVVSVAALALSIIALGAALGTLRNSGGTDTALRGDGLRGRRRS